MKCPDLVLTPFLQFPVGAPPLPKLSWNPEGTEHIEVIHTSQVDE